MAGTGLLALLAKPKGGASKEALAPAGKASDGGSEVGSALMDMFDALKGGDAEGAELAFRRAKDACDDSYEAEEGDEEMASEGDDDLDL